MTTTNEVHVHRATEQAHALDSFVNRLRERREARAAYRTAERELSTYTSPADLQELDAMLERSGDQPDSVYTHIIEGIRFRAA